MFSAAAAWPGCGRSAWRSAANTRSVASNPSALMAAVDVGKREQGIEIAQRQDQHSEHAIGAVDQRQALLLGEHDRRDPVRRQALQQS